MTNPLPDESDERLCDWMDGTMTARELQRFDAELRVSKQLRDRADAYRRVVLGVREGLSQDLEPVDCADAVLARIRGISAPPLAPATPRGPRLPSVPGAWWRSALVAAGMLSLIFVLDRIEPMQTSVETASQDQPAAFVPPSLRSAAQANSADGVPVQGAAPHSAVGLVDAPRTMVPQLTLRIAPTRQQPSAPQQTPAADRAPRGSVAATDRPLAYDKAAASGVAENAGRFGGVDVLFGDLADSVRAIGPVRLQALAPSADVGSHRAWLASGRDEHVRTLLANVSAAATAFGYSIENGEARAAEVDARTPRAKSDAAPFVADRVEGPVLRIVIVLERPAK